jgi:hypothetical protein
MRFYQDSDEAFDSLRFVSRKRDLSKRQRDEADQQQRITCERRQTPVSTELGEKPIEPSFDRRSRFRSLTLRGRSCRGPIEPHRCQAPLLLCG